MKQFRDIIFESFPEGFFTNQKIKRLTYSIDFTNPNFTFVQIGANDGKLMDPIRRYILKYNWHGVFVEPVPKYFEQLKQNYRNQNNLQFANCAITHKTGTEILYVVKPAKDLPLKFNGMSTFLREHLINDLHKSGVTSPEKHIKQVKVQSLSLKDFFLKYKLKHVNLLVIDVEGYEPAILKQIKDLQYYPEAIIYEHHIMSKQERVKVNKDLEKLGYKIQNAGFPWIDTLAYLSR